MKKIFLFSALIAMILSGGLFANDKVKIITTLTDLASLAEVVGGDKVEVQALAKGTHL